MADEDPAYTKWLRTLPCRVPCCFRQVEVHHARIRTGLGMRPHDRMGMPLCRQHHTELHALSGHFAGWTKAQLREWQQIQIEQLELRKEDEDNDDF